MHKIGFLISLLAINGLAVCNVSAQIGGAPKRLAFASASGLLAVATNDQSIKVWDMHTGLLKHSMTLELPGTAVAISSDGNWLVAGTEGTRSDVSQPVIGKLWAWRLDKATAMEMWSVPLIGSAVALAIEPQQQWCTAIGVYANTGVYRLEDGRVLHNWTESGNSPRDVAISDDGRTIVTVGQSLILWNVPPAPTPDVAWDRPLSAEASRNFIRGQTGGASRVLWLRDHLSVIALGHYRNTSGLDIELAMLNATDAKLEKILLSSIKGITCMTLMPDSQSILLGFEDGKIQRLDCRSGKTEARVQIGDFGMIDSFATIDNHRVAVVNEGGYQVRVIDIQTGATLDQFWPSANP